MGAKILIVEDEIITAMDLRSTLEDVGYEIVSIARTGNEAFIAAGRYCPDLILMDIILGGPLDGIEVAEAIRKSYHIPVVFVTAHSDEATVARAMQTIPYGYVVKPVDIRELHATIQTVLVRYSLESALTRREGELNRANRALKVLSDTGKIVIDSQNEVEFIDRICRKIIEYCDYRFVWVGYADGGVNRRVIPVARAGSDSGYLDALDVRWGGNDDEELSPCGLSIWSASSIVVKDIQTDERFEKWRDDIIQRKFTSLASIPLRTETLVMGALNVYSDTPESFGETEVALLERLAADISHGISFLRAKYEREIAQSEIVYLRNFYEMILENINDGIVVIDGNGIISYMNSALERITGEKRDSMIGGKLPDVMPNDLRIEMYSVYCEAKARMETVSADHICSIGPGGIECFRSIQMIPLFRNKTYNCMIGALRDVTEEVKAKRWKDLYNLLAESSRDIILFFEKDTGVIIEANEAAVRTYGYSIDELRGLTIYDLLFPDMHENVRSGVEDADVRGALYETVHRSKDGSSIPVEVSSKGVDLEGKRVLVNIIRDSTERRNLEIKFLEESDERQRKIGRDLHDSLGQILTGVALMARSAEREAEKSESPFSDRLREIGKHVTEAIQVTRTIGRGLVPVDPGEKGLEQSLLDLVDTTARMTELSCVFECPVLIGNVNALLAQHLYYVALEAVTNAIRHGTGNKIIVELLRDENIITLVVRDNGVYIVTENISGGIGLKTMDYRARLFGGHVILDREGDWTVLRCIMNTQYEAMQR